MSPVNDSFMSGSLDHTVRIWDIRVNACQVGLILLMSSCLKLRIEHFVVELKMHKEAT